MIRRFALVFLVLAAAAVSAEERQPFPWLDPAGVDSPLLLSGNQQPSSETTAKFQEFAGDSESKTIVVPAGDKSSADLNVLPGAVVHSGLWTNDDRAQFIDSLAAHPDRIGFHLSSGAAIAFRGRQLQVLEGPAVTVLLAASAGRPLREIELKMGDSHDLTMLRRAAVERSLASFPPTVLPEPRVEHGTLFIHGGDTMPEDVVQRFFDLVGGKDAPIVILPIAGEGTLPDDISQDTRLLTRAGATNVKSLRARSRADVESPEFAAAINAARGVWFNGGRQWRFVDAYMSTKAEELFAGVLRRGGVIGGSSAGASIQSQYMPRGSPLDNTDMMAEGYERGLGFLPGVAVDQHFTQRSRHADMSSLMRRYPHILGIGLDESTAIIVRGSTAECIGRGHAHFYNYLPGPPSGDRDFVTASSGQKYDLVRRTLLP